MCIFFKFMLLCLSDSYLGGWSQSKLVSMQAINSNVNLQHYIWFLEPWTKEPGLSQTEQCWV